MPQWYGGSILNPDVLIPQSEQWKIQWNRLLRWYARVQKLSEKSKTSELTAYDHDDLISFFQNCFHLKDWIGAARADLKPKLTNFEKNNFEIRACRNICDGFKHKELTSRRHPDPDFNWYQTYDPFLAEAETSKNPISYHVAFAFENDIKKYNIFDLASKCITLWKSFIEENNM